MNAQSRTLLIDASHESRELLAELLGRGGVSTTTQESIDTVLASRAWLGCELVVVDCDNQPADALGDLAQVLGRTNTPTVAVGTNRPFVDWPESMMFVRKPYRYDDLLRRISELLEGAACTAHRAAA